MSIGFNEVADLDQLNKFINSTKSVEGSWLGKKLVVNTNKGEQVVSEAEIWDKFKKLQSEAPAVEKTWITTGLCANRLTQIHNQHESCPWYIRIFRNVFGFITEVNTKKKLNEMVTLVRNKYTEKTDQEKAVLMTKFVAKNGEQFPRLQNKLKEIGPSPKEENFAELADIIFEEVPLSELHRFLEGTLFNLLPTHAFDEIKAKTTEKLKVDDNVIAKMKQLFSEEDAKILQNLFKDILHQTEHVQYEPHVKKPLTEKNITEMNNLLYTYQLYVGKGTQVDETGKLEGKVGSRNAFIKILKENKIPLPENVKEF